MNYSLLFISYVVLWVLVAGLFAAVFLLYWHYGGSFKKLADGRGRQGPALNKAVSPYPVLDVNHRELRLGDANGAFQVVLFGMPSPADPEFHADFANYLTQSKGLVETILVVDVDTAPKEYLKLSRDLVVVCDPEWKISRHWNVRQQSFCVLLDNQGIVRLKGLMSTTNSLKNLYSRCGVYRTA